MTPALFRSMLLVFAASIVGSFGAVFLKLGAARINSNVLSFLNSRLALGVTLFLGLSVFYTLGIRGGQLSILYPMVSLGIPLDIALGAAVLQRSVHSAEVVGLGLILGGVVLVGMGAA